VDLTSYAELAVRLVNSTTPGGDDRGGLTTVEAYRTLVADRPHLGGRVTAADLEGLRQLRDELRLIFAAAAANQETEVADRLNALLVRYPVHPHIVRHDGQRWHMHLVESGSAADRFAAGAVAGLTGLMAEWGSGRLATCASAGCERVFVGPGPRHCSDQCMSRENVRAIRSTGRGRAQRPAAS
jgi:predicted RNA-binding Zn ribbon-like protein